MSDAKTWKKPALHKRLKWRLIAWFRDNLQRYRMMPDGFGPDGVGPDGQAIYFTDFVDGLEARINDQDSEIELLKEVLRDANTLINQAQGQQP